MTGRQQMVQKTLKDFLQAHIHSPMAMHLSKVHCWRKWEYAHEQSEMKYFIKVFLKYLFLKKYLRYQNAK